MNQLNNNENNQNDNENNNEGNQQLNNFGAFIDIEFDSIIFINNQIDEFINAISSETIETGKNNHKEQKKAAEMFN